MVKALYLHIPFCSQKCPYCDFVSFVEAPLDHRAYLELLLRELELYRDFEILPESLYFGGGTPSLIKPELYAWFFKELSKRIDLSHVEEASLEINPEDYSLEDFSKLRDTGINRVSIGVQSLREEGLRALGRKHTVKRAVEAVENAHRAGFENINIDLIFGYEGQTAEELKEELERALELPIKHLSLYLLTPYEDTQFGHLYERGLLKLPSEDSIADMYELACELLEGAGFYHYEVSNFALEGFQCRHNLAYWSHEEFLGLGVSAWSFINKVRFGNTRNIRLYARKVLEGKKPVEYEEVLEGKELLYDYLFTALRTSRGVPKELLRGLEPELYEFFEEKGGRLALNRRGMLLINEVLLRLKKAILL